MGRWNLNYAFKLLNMLGAFPMEVTRYPTGEIVLQKSLCNTAMCFFWTASSTFGLAIGFLACAETFHGMHVGDFMNVFKKNGMTVTDVTIVNVIIGIWGFATWKMIFAMNKCPHAATKFLTHLQWMRRSYSSLPSLSTTLRKSVLKAAVTFSCLITYPCGYGYVLFTSLPPEDPLHARLITTSLYGLALSAGFFSLPLISFLVGINFLLENTSVMAEQYRSRIEQSEDKDQAFTKKNSDQKLYWRNLIDTGNVLIDTLELLSSNELGTLFFEECGIAFAFSIIGLYMSTGMAFITDLTNLRLTLFWLAFCSPNLFLLLASLVRFATAVEYGEKIARDVKAARDNLRDLMIAQKMNCFVYDGNNIPLELSSLRERMLENGYIVPRGYFKLNREMAMSAGSAFITYFIVLLQFKASEKLT